MPRALAALLLVAALAPGRGGAVEWTAQDTALEVAYLGLHLADWRQTVTIAEDPGRWHEHNPVLGRHPSRAQVNALFIAGAVLHPVVSYLLPRKWRTAWQASGIGLELLCVGNNAWAGIAVTW